MLTVTAQLTSRGFDIDLTVRDGETLAILGPNGAGKSTLFDVLVGLARPDTGCAVLGEAVLFDLGPGANTWMPPSSRGISLLSQQALLFPRMTVLDNVAFGPRSRGAGRQESRRLAAHWLEQVDAAEFAQRKPAQLSGGQAQRIAIARALAASPALLLLDEPMAALDVTVTPALRRLLRRVLANQTTILVTHDVLDAFTLADRVAVMNDGRVVELGETREVFEKPRSPFTAALVGLNLFTGIRTQTGLTSTDGHVLPASSDTTIPDGTGVGATLRPGALDLALAKGNDPNRVYIRTAVTDLEPRGDLIRVSTEFAFADIRPLRAATLDLHPGITVWVSYSPSELVTYRL